MKKILFLLLLISFNANAEDSFIIKNDGSKANIKSNSFRVDQNKKIIYYKLTTNDSEIKMSFNDFSSVEFGVNKFKIYKLNNSKEVKGYFILTETNDKTLISISKPDEDEDSKKVSYEFHILDNKNQVLESHFFNNSVNQKNADLRGEIYLKIRFYFSDCFELLKRLDMYDKNNSDINNTTILRFFNSPVYQKCI
ncbi:hypothetical protein [Flavobacterium sp.]|uniref:hypothetical protein n=1 Tax=Flavobacterium sp. TaxID=239 RepID=UPI00286EB03B|nr:hypothetical protein [Flavobacterium sp.]